MILVTAPLKLKAVLNFALTLTLFLHFLSPQIATILKAAGQTTNRTVKALVTSKTHISDMTTDKDRDKDSKVDTTTAPRRLITTSSVKVISLKDKLTTAHRSLLHHIIRIKVTDHSPAEATRQEATSNGKLNVEGSKISADISRTVAVISDSMHRTLTSNSNGHSATSLREIPVRQIHATAAVTVAIKHSPMKWIFLKTLITKQAVKKKCFQLKILIKK